LKRGKSSIKKSRKFAGKNQSPIFVETPTETIKCWKISYRLYIPETYLCIATDIALPTNISKQRASAWKRKYRSAQQTLHFIIHKM
jgi:16S rRNA (cytidine1402-2'-O)-methyltransferase